MTTQNYANHRQFVTMFHRVLLPVLLLTLVGSIVNLVESWGDHERLYSAALIFVLTLCIVVLAFLSREFSLKAQDRAIRAEESLRYFILTGKRMDPRLTMQQIIGLRFASDAEFPQLAQKAAAENLSMKAIKELVKNWRPDHDRL